jgi:hypothetical protein
LRALVQYLLGRGLFSKSATTARRSVSKYTDITSAESAAPCGPLWIKEEQIQREAKPVGRPTAGPYLLHILRREQKNRPNSSEVYSSAKALKRRVARRSSDMMRSLSTCPVK